MEVSFVVGDERVHAIWTYVERSLQLLSCPQLMIKGANKESHVVGPFHLHFRHLTPACPSTKPVRVPSPETKFDDAAPSTLKSNHPSNSPADDPSRSPRNHSAMTSSLQSPLPSPSMPKWTGPSFKNLRRWVGLPDTLSSLPELELRLIFMSNTSGMIGEASAPAFSGASAGGRVVAGSGNFDLGDEG